MQTFSRTLKIACLLFACAHPARGESPARPSAAELANRQRYSASLSKGRQLADAGKIAEARQAFSDCLTIAPDDPTALSELGWIEMRAKELDQAEATTRKAIARAGTPNLRAASLFNLGMILSKRNDPKGATEALMSSLRLRPNATALAELRKLDPTAAEKLKLAPHAMQGPLAAEDKTGKALRAKVCWQSIAQAWPDLEVKGPDERIKCTEQRLRGDLAGSGLLDVQVWQSQGTFNWPKDTLTLAIRTERGWYLDRFESYWSNRWVPGELSIGDIELATMGTQKVVTVKWTLSVDDWTWDLDAKKQPYNGEGRDVETKFLVVAGVGESGTPRITAAVPIGILGRYRERPASADLAVSFPGSGVLRLEGPKESLGKVPKAKFKDLVEQLGPGEFSIEFP